MEVNSEHLFEAYGTLASCECHPGAVCRTALELAFVMNNLEDTGSSEACLVLFEHHRQRINDVNSCSLGSVPSSYERFVPICLR